MALASNKVRILLIRPWTEPLAPFRSALRNADIDARIVRIDIEPAMNAALGRSRFDIVVLDPRTKDVKRSAVEACLRDHRSTAVLVILETLDSVAPQIKRALARRLN